MSDVYYDGTENDKAKITFEEQNDCLLNATWHYKEIEKYTISFDANGGTGSMDSVIVEKGTKYKLPACGFTPPEGKMFDAWDLGTPETEITVTGNIVIKALWKDAPQQQYTVTVINDGNGTGVPDPASGVSGTVVTLTATPNEGYVFKAWEVISGGVNITDNRFVIGTANVEIKATFEVVQPQTITVGGVIFSLDAEYGTAVAVGTDNQKIKSVTIPATITDGNGKVYKVTAIASNAFKGLKKLTKVSIGKNTMTIGKNAFSDCTKLKTVSGGAGVVTIEDAAFQKCTAMKEFTIGKKVTKIGKNAFKGCKNLNAIIVKATKLKSIGKKAFNGIAADAVFKCPKKLKNTYEPMIRKAGAPKTATVK